MDSYASELDRVIKYWLGVAGGDIYCEVASTIYERRIEPERDKKERQVGKVIVLAAAYGMDANRRSAS